MSIRKSTATALTTVVLVALSGCSSNDDTTAANDTSAPAPDQNPTEEVTLQGLTGTWNQSCLASDSTASRYSLATLVAADNVATVTQTFFTDVACSNAASPATSVEQHSLVFSGTTSNTALGDALHVDSTVESRSIDGVDSSDGVNTVTHDIALILNNTLYFGNKQGSNNGSTADLRPTELDQQAIYTR